VSPKSGDAVAVVARSVEAKEDDVVADEIGGLAAVVEATAHAGESSDVAPDATIEDAPDPDEPSESES